tara:strand:+ start:4881 stop:5330 length:450 start_codon:yes stop_codon:yes gene_type:complete
MSDCGTGDFMFPMSAEVYYPDVSQGSYGNVKKNWMLDKTVSISVSAPGSAMKQEVTPNANITMEKILSGRVKQDIRVSEREQGNSLTNIIVTNIKDQSCNQIYVETAGVRAGKATIFEVATQEPFVGPFGSVEYYKIVLRRSENQGVDV